MSSGYWTVEVDGVDRNVSVITDPENGKASIRVDGRMAARPLAPEEQEREIAIGRARYMLHRAGDGFDLELIDAPVYIPPPPASRITREQKLPEKKSGPPIFKIVAGVVGAVVFLFVSAYTRQAWAYMHVPWSQYKAPEGEFLLDFPGEPETESEDHNVAGTIVTMTMLHKQYRNHFYSIQYTKLPFVVADTREAPLAQELMESYVKTHNGTILTRDPAYVAQHNGVKFTAHLPKTDAMSECIVSGAIAIRKGHAYGLIFARPPKDSMSMDGDHFMNSFKLPED